MNELEALVGLNMVSDIGSIRLGKLLDLLGKPQNIFEAPAEKLRMAAGIGEKSASAIHSLKAQDLAEEFRLASKNGLKIITCNDQQYPAGLKHIPDPPIVLYVKGEWAQKDLLSIAIVGSRNASFYGLSNAADFSRRLSERGFTIVSGMARGIDTYAHKGALKQRGRTIAVMGSGFNHIYPPENRGLCEEISKNGAVISEFPMNARPLRQNFPRRNRVISGLSLGVLVVEAAKNSGALITVDFALEQGREVFALPGKIDSSHSYGPNHLIKQGAKLVSCVEDILEEMEGLYQHKDSSEIDTSGKDQVLAQESSLYGLISQHPVSMDYLQERTNLGIPLISGMLLNLQIRKMVKQLPGKQFIRS
ncbi:MAG: DNA-processing protein DprA [Candidatus Omnitrophica bacterium]|nr:DNA-processing protein DprA [Candidatus Omnitrophota bacterium]